MITSQVNFSCEVDNLKRMDNLDGTRSLHINRALRRYLDEVCAPSVSDEAALDVVRAPEPTKVPTRKPLKAEVHRLIREFPAWEDRKGPMDELTRTPAPSPEDVEAQAKLDAAQAEVDRAKAEAQARAYALLD